MKQAKGDLWDIGASEFADAIVITTNGTVKNNGEAVMGRGCAKEASLTFPWLPKSLGYRLQTKGNVVQLFATSVGFTLVSFPVKHDWWERASLNLIIQSARDLKTAANAMGWEHVVMPQAGCGNGGLDWEVVEPELQNYLDDRFTAVSYD